MAEFIQRPGCRVHFSLRVIWTSLLVVMRQQRPEHGAHIKVRRKALVMLCICTDMLVSPEGDSRPGQKCHCLAGSLGLRKNAMQ